MTKHRPCRRLKPSCQTKNTGRILSKPIVYNLQYIGNIPGNSPCTENILYAVFQQTLLRGRQDNETGRRDDIPNIRFFQTTLRCSFYRGT